MWVGWGASQRTLPALLFVIGNLWTGGEEGTCESRQLEDARAKTNRIWDVVRFNLQCD